MVTGGPKDGDQIVTGAIITTEANELCQPVHDRMPGHRGARELRALARGATVEKLRVIWAGTLCGCGGDCPCGQHPMAIDASLIDFMVPPELRDVVSLLFAKGELASDLLSRHPTAPGLHVVID